MAEPASAQPIITDPDFQHAVDLMDAGDVSALHAWVDARPHLLSAVADEDGSFAGPYFKHSKLLWFVAENPIRNGTLPVGISDKDRLHDSDARGWATHLGHEDIVSFLDKAAVMMPAIRAVRTGDVEGLREWLQIHPERVNDVLGDNPRTLLHYATDWPGNTPRVGETIDALAAAGANVNVRYVGPATTATESPLHWAASSDDTQAVAALLRAGAEIDPTGGCIGNGTPLMLAVIFQNYRVAQQLVDAGATIIALALVAGMGRMDLVETFFDETGEFHNPYPSLPHYDSVSSGEREINAALCLASMGGCMEVVRYLMARGANVNTHSAVNTTPLDEATNKGHEEVAVLLQSAGGKSFAELAPQGGPA